VYEPFRTWFAWAAGTQREAVTAVGTADMAQLTDRANDQGVGEEEEEEEEEEEKADGKPKSKVKYHQLVAEARAKKRRWVGGATQHSEELATC